MKRADWYEAWAELDGELRKAYIFCLRSMASGGAFHRAYPRANQQSFLEAHELQRHSWIPVRNYAIFLHGVIVLSNKVDGLEKTHQEYATFFIRSYTTFELNSGDYDRSNAIK
jgi:hypothetical protein